MTSTRNQGRRLTPTERKLLERYRVEVLAMVRAFLHFVPHEGDRVAEYSNGTVLRIMDAIAKLPLPRPHHPKSKRKDRR